MARSSFGAMCKISSGVVFYPPSARLWRIGGNWYNLAPFLERHPGGAEVVRLARARFEDSTYAFEAHHHNYRRARTVLARYRVSPPAGTQHSSCAAGAPLLADDDAFYSVLRRRLTQHLRSVACPRGGPTNECVWLFWGVVVAYVLAWGVMFATGTLVAAFVFGGVSALLGAFGHNWVHQPDYRLWSYVALDTVGFSSTGWLREHVLQHHMYTNTPWDNHFRGTEPFIVTDPTVERCFVQRHVTPVLHPLLLTLGLYANYGTHLVDMLRGREEWRLSKAILPFHVGLVMCRWGLVRGGGLTYAWGAVLGLWYFTLALMNHNAEHALDVDARNAARDWGEAQLRSSTDWHAHLPFRSAWIYLWLNYHTVHHLFPRLDFSHHPAAQAILVRTCREMGVAYCATASPWTIYCEMIVSFSRPRSFAKEFFVYGANDTVRNKATHVTDEARRSAADGVIAGTDHS